MDGKYIKLYGKLYGKLKPSYAYIYFGRVLRFSPSNGLGVSLLPARFELCVDAVAQTTASFRRKLGSPSVRVVLLATSRVGRAMR